MEYVGDPNLPENYFTITPSDNVRQDRMTFVQTNKRPIPCYVCAKLTGCRYTQKDCSYPLCDGCATFYHFL
jgi:hypothetical protein